MDISREQLRHKLERDEEKLTNQDIQSNNPLDSVSEILEDVIDISVDILDAFS